MLTLIAYRQLREEIMHIKCPILVAVVTIVVSLLGNVFASEEAWDILTKAFENGGDNPSVFTSAAAEFRVETTVLQGNTTTKTQKQMKVLLSGNNMLYSEADPRKCKRRLEIIETPDYLEGKIWTTLAIAMGSPNEPDSYVAFEWKPGQSLLERFQGRGDVREIPEFQRFGRIYCIPGPVSRIFLENLDRANRTFSNTFLTEFNKELKKQDLSCEIVGEVNYQEGAVAKVIEIKQNDICCEKYHIDSSRGYLCPYAWAADKTANFSIELSARDYFQEKQTSLYYPQYYRISQKTIIGENIQEYHLLPDTLQLNQRISDNEFAIDVPEDAYVHDLMPYDLFSQEGLKKLNSGIPITREITAYRAIKKGTISFVKGEFEIDKLKWLKRDDLHNEEIQERGRTINYGRIVSVFVGTMLIIFALYLLSRKKHAKY